MKVTRDNIAIEFGNARFIESTSKKTGAKTVICKQEYRVYLPGLECEGNGYGVDFDDLMKDRWQVAIGMGRPKKGDTYNKEIGMKVARARAEISAYRHARYIANDIRAAVVKLLDDALFGTTVKMPDGSERKIEGFNEKCDKVIDANNKYCNRF